MISAVYQIDWVRFVEYLLPVNLRRPAIMDLLGSAIKPIEQLHTTFLAFRDDANYRLEHNSQVVYLEKMLRDYFDNTLRRIYISNAETNDPVWFFEQPENRPVHFYEIEGEAPVYFHEESELGGGVDFIVNVPIDLKPATEAQEETLLIRMRALIDYYKLYSKNYIIKWVED